MNFVDFLRIDSKNPCLMFLFLNFFIKLIFRFHEFDSPKLDEINSQFY